MSTPKQAAEIWVKQRYGKAKTEGFEHIKEAFLAGASHSGAEIADLRAKLAARERACEKLRKAFQSSVIAIDTLIAFVCPEGLTLAALQRISEASSAALVAALDSGTPNDKGGA